MANPKLTINWDELKSRRVDNRLREQGAMERNREYAEMQEASVPAAPAAKAGLLTNAIICMALFGLIGGVLAWGSQWLVVGPLTPTIGKLLDYDPNAKAESVSRLEGLERIDMKRTLGQFTDAQAKDATELALQDGKGNPYFRNATDKTIDEKTRRIRVAVLEANDRYAIFWINVLSYGICGLMIATSLAIAEPLTQHKLKGTIFSGAAGAVLGILGGITATLLVDRISDFSASVTHHQSDMVKRLTSDVMVWGMLGLFIGLGSGIVMMNLKKLVVGIIGGLIGGLIGGTMFQMLHNPLFSRLIALVAIGVIAGLATGLLENVVKGGWLKVTSGIIAGKQFILYRNPTYIGSSPDCQIYLFKDANVGKRHAAIHILPTGIEIENLPLGTATLVNGKMIQRSKLKNGDTVQISKTSFRFQEKRPSAGN